MESSRVEAYLRSVCSVLDFYVGELWCARKGEDDTPTLTFVQLYTSPAYEDFQSLLLQPQHRQSHFHTSFEPDDVRHRFSPTICRGVCDGGQIVWANTCTSEGLVGRSDLPLNTAVGLPVCSINQDLFIFVLFSVDSVPITPNAIEFLCSLTRAITDTSPAFLPAAVYPVVVKAANTKQFVGIWDMLELIETYSSDVAFHLLPIDRIQKHFDYEEYNSVIEIFNDFKQIRDSGFTAKQLDSLRVPEVKRLRSNSPSNESNHLWNSTISTVTSRDEFSHMNHHSNAFHIGKSHQLVELEYSHLDSHQGFPIPDNNVNQGQCTAVGPGAFTADLDAVSETGWSWFGSEKGSTTGESQSGNRMAGIDARVSYRKNPNRFHEFMVAVLGMTVMDAAELWLLADRSPELHLAAALHKDGVMSQWTSESRDLGLRKGVDVPGQMIGASLPQWDNRYDQHVLDDPAYPRASLAARLGVRTAVTIPLPGPKGTSAVLAFYSRSNIDVDLLFVTFLVKGSLLVSVGELDPEALSFLNVENLLFKPVSKLLLDVPEKTLQDGHYIVNSNSQLSTTKSPAITIQHMGSLVHGNKMDNPLHRFINGVSYNNHHPSYAHQQGFHGSFVSNTNNSHHWTYPSQQAVYPVSSGSNNIPVQFHYETVGGMYGSNRTSVSNFHPISSFQTNDRVVELPSDYNLALDLNSPINVPMMPIGISPVASTQRNKRSSFKDEEYPSFHSSVHSSVSSSTHSSAFSSTHSYTIPTHISLPENIPVREVSTPSSPSTVTQPGVLCRADGCPNVPSARSFYCQAHSGFRRCMFENCSKCAQGSTNYCIAHGGGRRCTFPGCDKGARGKFFCAAHGGGKRCADPNCMKAAVGGSQMCTAHGGGKRCSVDGCTKSSQSNTNLCVRHGGGRKCIIEGCVKVARGKTDHCAAHGTAVKCRVEGCKLTSVGDMKLCSVHQSGMDAGMQALPSNVFCLPTADLMQQANMEAKKRKLVS